MNNFYLFFPEMSYRVYLGEESCSPLKIKIMADLDKLIEESNFDNDEFKKEVRLWHEGFYAGIKLLKKKVNAKFNNGGVEHHNQAMAMIKPFYKKLREMGYEQIDLIR